MPKGSQIIYTSPTEQQVYSTAAINGDDLTISVVNHSGKEQQVLVKIPEATKKVDLSVYAYFKDDLNQDETDILFVLILKRILICRKELF